MGLPATDEGTEARAVELLSQAPGFSVLPASVLAKVAAELEEQRFPAGQVVLSEGDLGDRLYVIHAGQAEVTVKAPSGPVPLALLQPGELFGELALLEAEPGRRQATVTAVTPLVTFTLSAAHFRRLLQAHPELAQAFQQVREDLEEARFLKRASPFTALCGDQLRRLAGRLDRLIVPTGRAIVREGEAGDACYLLLSGQVEVVRTEPEGERRIAQLGPGALFGEAALLTASPRSATVRTLAETQLLVLRREDLLEVIGDPSGAARVLELFQLRARPRPAPGVEAHHRPAPDGTTVTILKNPRQGTYYRLSPEGWFLWQRLDGKRNLRDLTMEYFREFKALAPHAVAEIVAGLSAAGFAEVEALRAEVQQQLFRPTPWQRALLAARRLLEWRVSVSGLDPLLTRLYQGGVRYLCTPPALTVMALLALAGLGFFFAGAARAQERLPHTPLGPLLAFLIPTFLLALLFHELGHAFATKAFGREVHRAGVGWYWFTPVAFVDTSDMWLSGRGPRIWVNLAGLIVDSTVAGAAALAAWLSPHPFWSPALWQFSYFLYLAILTNLSPLLEYDGYFVLMDWLDRPNLRRRALSWIGGELPKALRTRADLRPHLLELIYGTASLAYVVLAAVLTVVTYRLLVQSWVERVLPPGIAAALVWVLAAAVVLLGLLGLLGDLRAGTERETK